MPLLIVIGFALALGIASTSTAYDKRYYSAKPMPHVYTQSKYERQDRRERRYERRRDRLERNRHDRRKHRKCRHSRRHRCY